MKLFAVILVLSALGGEFLATAGENDFPESNYLNTSADPCDNFYEFTCGNFKNVYPRPEKDLSIDQFSILLKQLLHLANDMLQNGIQKDDPEAVKKIKMAYKACINTELPTYYNQPENRIIEEVGGMPLVSISSEDDLKFSFNEVGDLVAKYGVSMLFNYQLYPDMSNSTRYNILMTADNMANPSFIRSEDKTYDDVLEEDFRNFGKHTPHVTTRNLKLSEPQPFDIFLEKLVKTLRNSANPNKTDALLMEDLQEVTTLMRAIALAGSSSTVPENMDLPSIVTLGELNKWTKSTFGNEIDIDWVEYLQKVFGLSGAVITEDTLILQAIPKVIYGVLDLIRNTNPKVLKNFALMRIFLFLAPDSDAEIRSAFEDYYKAKNFNLYPRWEYCTRKIMDATGAPSLSFALAYDYQRHFFNVNKLSKAVELVKNIESTFKETLNNSDWLESSKTAALEKAKKMVTLLGYPDLVQNESSLDKFYENIRVCEWDNYGNSQRIRAFKMAYPYSEIDKQKNRAFWDKSPFEANAYYNRPNNRMVFPIAMLNPIFFRGTISAIDYGRIGAIIGHEITHGYDSSGKNYDGEGTMTNWWTNSTSVAFKEKTNCFVDQYNQYFIDELNKNVNGTETLNENLADNGGIRTAYKSLKKIQSPYTRDQKVLGDFTEDQLFFIGFGTMWCADQTPAYLAQIKTYPPNKHRVNGAVSNMVEFAETFGCSVGSKMNPVNKCILW